MTQQDAEFEDICNLIIGRALDSYVKSEYGNLWETHQCRPHGMYATAIIFFRKSLDYCIYNLLGLAISRKILFSTGKEN